MKVYAQMVRIGIWEVRLLPLAAYIGVILLANWAVNEYGIVNIGLGQTAPAGVFFAGLAFTFRDLTHETLGRIWVVIAIIAGALLSWWISSPALALASGIAFLCSELADLSVYEPLRKHHWLTAVALSNTVGLLIDSALFLWLAFGSLDFIQGQIIGKFEMTWLAIIVLWIGRKGAILLRDSFAQLDTDIRVPIVPLTETAEHSD